jgi:hypothetical protein
MPDDSQVQPNAAAAKYLKDLQLDELLLTLAWEDWLKIDAPYADGNFTVRDVTTRYHRNGYDWVMHAKLYTPEKERDSNLGFFAIHGGAGSANNMDHTPDGRPGLARVLAVQGIKTLSCSFTGHYPPNNDWKLPVAERQPLYLFDQELPLEETLDRNLKCTFNVNMQGAVQLIEEHLAARKVLAFGHSTGGPMAAQLHKWTTTAQIIGLPGFGTGGPDGWKREWSVSINTLPQGFEIDQVSRRSVKSYKSSGYEDPEDLCPWGGPEAYMKWADANKSQMKTALCDNQHNGNFDKLEQVVKKTGLPREEYFDHFSDPEPDWLKSASVLLIAGENDKGHWVKGGDVLDNKREMFFAKKYRAAGAKRIHVLLVPRYGHVGYAELYNEKFVYLWLWAYKNGYFS